MSDYKVDSLLNNWFGEPPEYSDDEKTRLSALYNPLRKMEDELNKLRKLVDNKPI